MKIVGAKLLASFVAGMFVLGSAHARWVSTDPVQANPNNGQNFNRYNYANNNPYRFTDPDGRQALDQSHKFIAAYETCAGTAGCTPDQVPEQIEDATGPYGNAILGVGIGGAARGLGSLVFRRSAAEAGYSVSQANKIHHIFSQARHNLGGLAKSMGSEVKAYRAIEKATLKAVDPSKSGKFETVVKVGGEQVTVRGTVVDGQVKIGTAFVKPPPPPPPPRVR